MAESIKTIEKDFENLIFQASKLYHGPLPPPDVLQAYEEISPGAAERILKMAERQMELRHSLEKALFMHQSKVRSYRMMLFWLSNIVLVGALLFFVYDSSGPLFFKLLYGLAGLGVGGTGLSIYLTYTSKLRLETMKKELGRVKELESTLYEQLGQA